VALISDPVGLEPAASIHSSLWPGALGHVGGRPHLSPHVLPFTSVTHFYMGYYSFYRPRKNERRVGLVGWLIADGLPT